MGVNTQQEIQVSIENFPEKLKDLRQQKSMTQKELADKLSVTQQMVSALEKGKIDPSLKVLGSIALILGVILVIGDILKKGGNKNG